MPDRPKDMYKNGRPVVPGFDPDEWLYHRLDPEFIQPDGTIDAMHVYFRFPDLSSNRSKFSEPWYVLYPREEFGDHAVVKFRHKELPATVKGEGKDSPEHRIRAEHVPYDDNYGHCEIRVYKGTKQLERTNQLSRAE